MEDSGYYSHKSGEFKLFSSASSSSSYRRRLFSQELLKLDYEQLKKSDKFKHLVSGFRDENDFEEFKQDLRDFWKLKEDTCEEFGNQNCSSPEHMLMEFFNSDENFKEFERVFDDFKHHRFYDFDELKKRRSRGDPRLSEDGGVRRGADRDETFSDFFDNDEDFQEFEEEFANFKVMQRRSRALDDFNRRSWCDLRSDINASCDRKAKTDNANAKQSFPKDEALNNRCHGDRHQSFSIASEKNNARQERPEDLRQFKQQSSSDDSQYYTCRDFPECNSGKLSRESNSAYPAGPGRSQPIPDPPSYDFVMQNRKCKPNVKSHSCDYDDRSEQDFSEGKEWNPKSHSRSQSYDFSPNSQNTTNEEMFNSNSKNRSSDFSKATDHSYSSANRKSSTRSHSQDIFEKSEEQFNRQNQKTASNVCNRSQSYDFSKVSEETSDSKKFSSKSQSFDLSNDLNYTSSDKKSSAFTRNELHDFSENVSQETHKDRQDFKSQVHSSNTSNDSKYEFSAHDKKSNKTSRSHSYDFSESLSNESTDSSRKSNSNRKSESLTENSKFKYNGCDQKSTARTTSRSQSQDFSEKLSEKVSNDSRASKLNRSSFSTDSSESSKYEYKGVDKKANTTSRSQAYNYSESAEEAQTDRKSGPNVYRHSCDASDCHETTAYKESKTEKGCAVSNEAGKSRYSDSFCDYSHLGKKYSSRDHAKGSVGDNSSSVSEADFYDCSEGDGSSNEDIYREIYHGSTDFSQRHNQYSFGKYRPSKLATHLPTVYSRHSSDSEIHMGGTYPNIRLDRIPGSEGLKRRSAEYFQNQVEDALEDYLYNPYSDVGPKDYGQRRSRSDYSVYNPKVPQKIACAKCLSQNCHNPVVNDCQYTCHHRCRPLVTLDCTAVSEGSNGSTQDVDEHSAETSLSEMYNCQTFQSDYDASQSPESSQNEDTDSGYRSGGIQSRHLTENRSRHRLDPDSIKREELRKLIDAYCDQSPSSFFCFIGDSLAFQGFIRVTLNLIRPITMSLGARPPSIYEVLTKEHIVEQNTMSISFYMPRDTIKQIHVTSENTTKEVVTALLKKYKILDNPRKFAMYAQELENGKIVKLWRVGDKDFPLQVCLNWGSEDLKKHRLVLQENETGEIEWNAFSQPELQNFMRILDKEEGECVAQLQYKYKVMKRIIQQRMKEIRKERKEQSQRS